MVRRTRVRSVIARVGAVFVGAGVLAVGSVAAVQPAAAAPSPRPPGTVFVSQFADPTVLQIAPNGTETRLATGTDAAGVAVDSAGDVFATNATDGVVEYPVGGGPQRTVGSGLSIPAGLAIDAAGNIYVADLGNDRVVKIPAGGGPQTTVGTGWVDPIGVAIDPIGNVYVADRQTGQVSKVAPDGTQTVVVTGLQGVQGLTVTSDGTVFVADAGTSRVIKVPPGGGPGTPVSGSWLSPTGVALDADGNLYVSDLVRSRVVKVPADGGPQTIVGTSVASPTGVAVYAPAPTFLRAPAVSDGTVGVAYSTAGPVVSTPAGEPAPRFSVVNGSLPPGLTVNAATGQITGTPTTPGTYRFQLQVANAATGSVSAPLSIIIDPMQPGFVRASGPDRFGDTAVPASVGTNPSGVTSMAASYDFSLAVASGGVVGWGDNSLGQTTIPAAAKSGVATAAATSLGGLALRLDNTLVEWGFQAPPIPAGLSGALAPHISAITGANVFYLALANGAVTEWGAPDNGFGISAVPAAAKTGVVAIDSGTGHALALKDDGSVIAWGYNNAGQATVPVAAQSFVKAIAAAANHSLALKNDGTLIAWGDNSLGTSNIPAAAQGKTIAIAAGGSYNAALLYDGTILTWGTPDTTTTIPNLTDGTVPTALAAGDRHLLVLQR